MNARLRLPLLWGGCLLYIFILVIGLYANWKAPRWETKFEWTGEAWRAQVSATPILVNDEVLQVGGIPVSYDTLLVDNAFLTSRSQFLTWLKVKEQLYLNFSGSSIEVQVLRGDAQLTLEVPLSSQNWKFLRSEASSHLLVSLVFFLVGVAAYSPEPNKQVVVFYLLCVSMSLVYLTNAMSLMAAPVLEPWILQTLNLLNSSQFVFAPAFLFHFALLMPRDRAPRWFLILLYGASALTALTLSVEAAGFLVPLWFLGSLVAILHGALSCRTTLERQQMKWVGTGFLLGVGPWLLINGLPLVVLGKRLMSDTLPGACLVAIPIFMAVAVKRYRLFDVGAFLEGTFIYVCTLGILLGLDLLLLTLLDLDEQFSGSHLLVIGSLLAFWAPLRGRLSSAFARFIHREEVNDRVALDKLSRRLSRLPFSECHEALQGVVHELYGPSNIELEVSDKATGVYLDVEEAATVLLVIAEGLALRCGPLPKGRVYHSRATKQLEILTKHCALFYESGLRLKEKEALLDDLHDGVGSALAKIRLSTTDQAVQRLAQDALFELQSFLYADGDSTFDCKDLVGEMRSYGNDFFASTDFELILDAKIEAGHLIARSRALSVFRLYRESLTNILKHSSGQNVHVSVQLKDSNLVMRVSDDGEGAEGAVLGRGIDSMKGRALKLGGTISLQRENGFTVGVSIPL